MATESPTIKTRSGRPWGNGRRGTVVVVVVVVVVVADVVVDGAGSVVEPLGAVVVVAVVVAVTVEPTDWDRSFSHAVATSTAPTVMYVTARRGSTTT